MSAKLTPLKPYEPGWEHGYCTRGGKPARVICTDRTTSACTHVFLVMEGDKEEEPWESVRCVDADGTAPFGAADGRDDIMCAAPPKAEPMTVYVVQDKNGKLSVPCHTLEAAERHRSECAFHFGSLSPWEILTFVQKPEDVA